MPETIDIPGGTAEMWGMDELTPKLSMPLSAYTLRCSAMISKMRKTAEMQAAAKAVTEEGADPAEMDMPDLELTEEESEQFLTMQYLAAFVYLKSWTIGRPLPATFQELMDLPNSLVQPLVEYANKANTQAAVQSAGIEESEATVMDLESPTVPSESSGGPSDSSAPTPGSTPGDSAGSPSTSS